MGYEVRLGRDNDARGRRRRDMNEGGRGRYRVYLPFMDYIGRLDAKVIRFFFICETPSKY